MAVTAPLTMTMTVLPLILMAFDSVQSRPNHLGGPDDMFVFKDREVNLTCNIISEVGYAIVWHVVAINVGGTFVGRCYKCPTQEYCSVLPGMEDDYQASREGNAYTLTIRKPQVPTLESFGHFECGYQQFQNCNPTPISRFFLLKSAQLYVYDSPSCSSSVATLDSNRYQDLTCTWAPRFYDNTGYIVEANITHMDRDPNFESVKLPHGIVHRISLGSPQEPEGIVGTSECTVVLSDTMRGTCKFPQYEQANVLIDPLRATIRAGISQQFHCDVQPNATMGRIWKIFKETGASENITSSTRTMAGDVIFPTDSHEYLDLRPHSVDAHFFIECSVVTGNGSVVSAYASVQTLGEEHSSQETITQPLGIIQSTPVQHRDKITVKPSGEPTLVENNMTGILIFTVVPIVLIVIFFVIGFAIVWKRTRKRSFKQPARNLPKVKYSNMGSNDNIVANVANDEDGYKEDGEK